jgi:hypothetical protein
MVRMLVGIVRAADATLAVTAQTLPSPGSPGGIRQKLGFAHPGSVPHPVDGSIWQWRLQRSDPGR